MHCQCQWINQSDGQATPDNNPAIAMAICHDPRSFGEKGSEPFPICEEHAKIKGEFWKLLPLPEQTEVHHLVLDDQRYFKIMPDVVIASIKKRFGEEANQILIEMKLLGDYWGFNRFGMFWGCESRDGFLHT